MFIFALVGFSKILASMLTLAVISNLVSINHVNLCLVVLNTSKLAVYPFLIHLT